MLLEENTAPQRRGRKKNIQSSCLKKNQSWLLAGPNLINSSTCKCLVNPINGTQLSTSFDEPKPWSYQSSELQREYRVKVTDKNTLAFASHTLSQSSASDFTNTYINTFADYVQLQNEIERKRSIRLQKSIKPKLPPKLKEYLLYKCNYLLAGNESLIQHILSEHRYKNHLDECTNCASDNSIIEELREQHKERNKLILTHKMERDKLRLAAELDVIRLRNKYHCDLKNIQEHYSACTFLKEQEIYDRRKSVEESSVLIGKTINQDTVTISQANIIKANENENENEMRDYRYPTLPNSRIRLNRRMFKVKLDERRDKWEYAKSELIARHQQEALSLYAYHCTVFENINHDFEIPKLAIDLNSYDYPNYLWLPL